MASTRGRKRRRTVIQTQIYRDSDQLLTEIMRIVPGFPRHFQGTAGADMEHAGVMMLRHLADVYAVRRGVAARLAALDSFDGEFFVVSSLLRKAVEFRWITRDKFGFLTELTVKIYEQSSAWRNSLTRQPAAPPDGGVGRCGDTGGGRDTAPNTDG